jgi:hypothetical protein
MDSGIEQRLKEIESDVTRCHKAIKQDFEIEEMRIGHEADTIDAEMK